MTNKRAKRISKKPKRYAVFYRYQGDSQYTQYSVEATSIAAAERCDQLQKFNKVMDVSIQVIT